MDHVKKNKRAIHYWERIQKTEKEYIEKNASKYPHLKARILGYLAGDGNIYIGKTQKNQHHSIKFFPDHDSLLKPYCLAFFKVYNKKPLVYPSKNKYCLTVDSKIITLDIISSAKFGLMKWQVPFRILANDQSKKEWLRAFFDAEAYVGKDHIKVQTVNKRGTNQVKKLLSYFGIKSNKYEYIPKNKKWNVNHILVIGRRKDLKRYAEKIGFFHTLKQNKLDLLKVYK